MGLNLPESKFGMTATNFRMPDMPDRLPEHDVLQAANDFNRYRYEELTAQQRVFVTSYLEHGFDATKAALDAYLTTDPIEAVKLGSRMVRKPYIQQAIEYATRYCLEKAKFRFDPDVYLKRLHAIATALVDEEGISDERAVKKYKKKIRTTGRGKDQETTEDVEFEAYSALDAIKMLFVLCDPARAAGQGKVPGAVGIDDSSTGHGHGNVMFEIIAVPSGEFIPAPLAPNALTIEHSN